MLEPMDESKFHVKSFNNNNNIIIIRNYKNITIIHPLHFVKIILPSKVKQIYTLEYTAELFSN